MTPYAELLEFNQPNPIRKPGFTRIRDQFRGLSSRREWDDQSADDFHDWVHHSIWNPERIVEFAGAWDYGESNAAKLGSRKDSIIRRWIDMGHESMLEMADATFFIECSRVVSHELVRHRIASFQQESQRFVKYDNESFDDLFFLPEQIEGIEGIYAVEPETWEQGVVPDTGDDGIPAEDAMIGLYDGALELYKVLREKGVAPQLARYVLPNAMRTRLVMKTNLREWRHICKLRLDKSAQPEMQELMRQIYDQLVDVFPNVMYNAVDGERGVR
jgi:thymidylate synthase (FAD)